MPVLGVDTSTRTQSIAVAAGGRVRARAALDGEARQSETLLPAIRMVLASAGFALRDLRAIAVTSGPGRFTGLRVTLATAKGLALGTGVPVRGFSTLHVLAEALARSEGTGASCHVCPLLSAGRGQVYAGLFRARRDSSAIWITEPVSAERVADPERAIEGLPEDTILGGDGAEEFRPRFEAALPPGARLAAETPELGPVLALRGEALLSAGGFSELPPLVPNYIRPADAVVRARR